MRKLILSAALLSIAAGAAAHISPNVTLVRRGDFLRQAFPDTTRFSEKALEKGALDAVLQGTGWRPSEEEARIYVARTAEGKLVGTAVFLWIPSQHGPIGIGAAFDPDGTVMQAVVTEIGSEPLGWVRPLLVQNRLESLSGLAIDGAPNAGRLTPAGAGAMTRYYAKVIAEAVRRAQAIERAARAETR
jgi:hypothetical protein